MDAIMITINYFKSFFSKFFAFILIAGLAVGCASITDANGDSDPQTEEVSSNNDPETIWDAGGDDDMDPIVVGPPRP